MFVTFRSQLAVCSLFLSLACGTLAAAQSPDAAPETPQASPVPPYEAYDRGARAYFAGRADEAQELLTAAIEYAPADPSARYLRGLNYLRQRNSRKAEADLSEGARLEAQHSGSASPMVDRAVAGVQGSDRLTLERIRREARRSAKLAEARSVAAAYKQARLENEERVLRTAYKLPLESLVSRLSISQAQEVAAKVSPAAMESIVAGDEDASPKSNAAAVASDNPFADDEYESDTPATAAAGDAAPAATGATTTNDVDVPEEARGSMSAGGFFGLFSNPVKRTVGSMAGSANEMAQQAMGGGAPPAGMADDFGPGEFNQDMGAEGNPFDFDDNSDMESGEGVGADDTEEDLF